MTSSVQRIRHEITRLAASKGVTRAEARRLYLRQILITAPPCDLKSIWRDAGEDLLAAVDLDRRPPEDPTSGGDETAGVPARLPGRGRNHLNAYNGDGAAERWGRFLALEVTVPMTGRTKATADVTRGEAANLARAHSDRARAHSTAADFWSCLLTELRRLGLDTVGELPGDLVVPPPVDDEPAALPQTGGS